MAHSGNNKSRGENTGVIGAQWFRNKKAKGRRKEQLAKASRKRNRGAIDPVLGAALVGLVCVGVFAVTAMIDIGHKRDQLLHDRDVADYWNMTSAYTHGVKSWRYPDGSLRPLQMGRALCSDFDDPQTNPRAKNCIRDVIPCDTDTDCMEKMGGDGGPEPMTGLDTGPGPTARPL